MDLPNPFLGKVHFFFSGLTAGPTYRPLVRHSNADTPLVKKVINPPFFYPVVQCRCGNMLSYARTWSLRVGLQLVQMKRFRTSDVTHVTHAFPRFRPPTCHTYGRWDLQLNDCSPILSTWNMFPHMSGPNSRTTWLEFHLLHLTCLSKWSSKRTFLSFSISPRCQERQILEPLSLTSCCKRH